MTYIAYGYGVFVRYASGDAEVFLFDSLEEAENAMNEFDNDEEIDYALTINTYKNGDANA